MAKVMIKRIPWFYETGGMTNVPGEGDYIRLPNGKYFVITSIFLPFDVREVKYEDIPKDAKIHSFQECN